MLWIEHVPLNNSQNNIPMKNPKKNATHLASSTIRHFESISVKFALGSISYLCLHA